MVAELNRRGIHVAAVGSFKREEIEGTLATPQRVRGETLPGPKELLFFHTIGDIQAVAEEGVLPLGQHALFNGACLLEPIEGGYATDPVLVEEIGALRAEFDLKLGFYVQEGDCDAAAASALSSLSDQRGDVFELGFAWGGLLDEAAIPAGDGDHRGFGSQAMLVQVGAARTWRSAGA